MPMTIAVDYDDTITLDREFWWWFIKDALADGHKLVVVSCRTDSAENVVIIRDWLGDKLGPQVYIVLTSHTSKREAVELEGLKIDVWIDDSPETVERGEPQRLLDAHERKHVALPMLFACLRRKREYGKRIVFTNGCFDLFHVGHLSTLQFAAHQGDMLVVAVNSDRSIRRLKGPTRPIVPLLDRVKMLSALECVDYIVVFDDPTVIDLMHSIRPDVFVKGGTSDLVGTELYACNECGCRIAVADVVSGISTSVLEERMKKA